MLWGEASLRLKLNGFEDGLNHTIDRLTYEILQEYREGVDVAHRLMLMEPPSVRCGIPLKIYRFHSSVRATNRTKLPK